MKKTKWVLRLILLSIATSMCINGCFLFYGHLSPPDWIQGTWQGSYLTWEFTSNNAVMTNRSTGQSFDQVAVGKTDSMTATTYTIIGSEATGATIFTKYDGTYITSKLSEGGNETTLYKQ